MESKKIKICIWMNIPSHHQSAFFDKLSEEEFIDLEVRYFHRDLDERTLEGWVSAHRLRVFEQYVDNCASVGDMISTVYNAESRVHITSSSFSSELINYFSKNNYIWCEWSECFGVNFAKKIKYNRFAFKLLESFLFILKRQQYSIVRNHSLGCFSQGVLSQKSFGRVGIDKRKISDLFYTPAPLVPLPADQDIVNFANGRSVFLCVSALCVRKGIDILIKAFSKLQTHDWVLVLVGVDKNNGYYQRLCRELGIQHLVFFAGKREVREIASVYTASDVFVLPTRFDGWGAVLNEAASLGLPLISTDMCGGAWHLIEHNVNGYRVRADSVSALLEALEKYVKNRDAIIIHSSKTKEIYFDNFLPQHNVKRLLAGIEKFKGNRIKND